MTVNLAGSDTNASAQLQMTTTPTWRERRAHGDVEIMPQPSQGPLPGPTDTEEDAGASGSSSNNSHGATSWWTPALASEVMYCTVSAGTTLFNKHALSTFGWPAPSTLLFFQVAMAVFLLQAMDVLGFITLQPLRWESVRIWLPVNLIFVAMNVTGFYALQDVGVGMFTVLKNLSNLMTIVGDYLIFNITYSWQVWVCLGLMIFSAMLGGVTDMSFSFRGYAWQLVNCAFTAAYSLYLSGVIKKLSHQQHGKAPLSELSMVYYNNLLSVPPLALLSLVSGETALLRGAPQIRDPEFQAVAIIGGLMGFGVSFASIWCMSRTSATIYSLTGSLNKVVVAVCGMWYFSEPCSAINLASIISGLVAGCLFVFARQGQGRAKPLDGEEDAQEPPAMSPSHSGGQSAPIPLLPAMLSQKGSFTGASPLSPHLRHKDQV
eukprot:CAMPEP_0119105772 /NCGR_PEP_ID=MMETSP1180-20130426/3641_1 /TAXON_ID=3052 ORGANISM="Chlamydomonas cf sp, Strain CCMP681" /NCGR_SAMPLE_ID=MMETSP1180 /ASSEMBLY_ACC=CAM_ASM_000741 /LENGTH=432 /DNA_ID=CAMNT_0007090911 /DNA_START=55 /DNA_END=1353 /DNA_ORIENTATION=+